MADVDNNVRLQLNDVEVRDSSARQTPNTSFGQLMRSGISGTMNTVSSGLNGGGGYMVPGSAVVGAAVSGGGGSSNVSGMGSMGGMSSMGGLGTGGMSFGGQGLSTTSSSGVVTGGTGNSGVSLGGMGGVDGAITSATGGTSGGSQAQLLSATQQMTEMNNVFNLQYLQLQENMQQENRQFSALSNVMKSKDDTAKNSLSNIK